MALSTRAKRSLETRPMTRRGAELSSASNRRSSGMKFVDKPEGGEIGREKSEKSEKPERPEKPEKSEKPEKLEKSEKPEKREKISERSDKPEKLEKTDKIDKSEKLEKREKEGEKVDKGETTEEGEGDETDQLEQVVPGGTKKPNGRAAAKRKREAGGEATEETLPGETTGMTTRRQQKKIAKTKKGASPRESTREEGAKTRSSTREKKNGAMDEKGRFMLPPDDLDYRRIEKQKLEELSERKKQLDEFRKRTEWLLEMISGEQNEIKKRIDELKAARLSQYQNGMKSCGDDSDNDDVDMSEKKEDGGSTLTSDDEDL